MVQSGVQHHSLFWYNDLLPVRMNQIPMTSRVKEIELASVSFQTITNNNSDISKQFDYVYPISEDKLLLISKCNRLIVLYTHLNGDIALHNIPSEVFDDSDWCDFDVIGFENSLWIGILYNNSKVAYFPLATEMAANSITSSRQALVSVSISRYKRIVMTDEPNNIYLIQDDNEIHKINVNTGVIIERYTGLVGENGLSLANTTFCYDVIRKSFIFSFQEKNRLYEYQMNESKLDVICGSTRIEPFVEGKYAADVSLSNPQLPIIFRPQLSRVIRAEMATISQLICNQGGNDLPNLLLFYDAGRNELRKLWRFPKSPISNYSRHNNVYTLMGYYPNQEPNSDLFHIKIENPVKCIRISQNADLAVLCNNKVILVTSPFSNMSQKMTRTAVKSNAYDS